MTTPAPHYVAPGSHDATRRLLLVSPAFPPAVEVGALRWQKIASLAALRGWQFDVITGAASEGDVQDERRLDALPAGTRVWIVPMPEPALLRLHRGVGRLLRPFRGAGNDHRGATIPSGTATVQTNSRPSALSGTLRGALQTARALSFFEMWNAWGDDVLALANSITRERPPEIIASSGPPHMAHLVAHRIATAVNRPFLIDLRDPWFLLRQQPKDMASALWRRRTERDESRTCAAASLIVTNTEASAQMLRGRYPKLASRTVAVMNGSDPDVRAFAGFNDVSFDIVHTGTVYFGRDPRNLFRAVRQFIDSNPQASPVVRVRFVGAQSYDGVPLAGIASQCGIAEWFSCTPPVARTEALTICGRAAVNVLLPQDEPLAIPSKVFEYAQFPAWILALAKTDDAVALLLENTPSRAVAPDDVGSITTFFTETFRAWANGTRPDPLNADGRFDRSRQVERLFQAIETVV